MRPLQALGELGGSGAGNEVTVGVIPVWQLDDASFDASAFQAKGELVRSLLPGLIFILVEDDVEQTARPFGKLRQLSGGSLGSDGARRVAKAGLPQDG